MLEREEMSNHELSNRIKRIVSDFNSALDIFDKQTKLISKQSAISTEVEIKVNNLNRQILLMWFFMCVQFVVLVYVGFCTFYD